MSSMSNLSCLCSFLTNVCKRQWSLFTMCISTRAPQGCVLSEFLYTNPFHSPQPRQHQFIARSLDALHLISVWSNWTSQGHYEWQRKLISPDPILYTTYTTFYWNGIRYSMPVRTQHALKSFIPSSIKCINQSQKINR